MAPKINLQKTITMEHFHEVVYRVQKFLKLKDPDFIIDEENKFYIDKFGKNSYSSDCQYQFCKSVFEEFLTYLYLKTSSGKEASEHIIELEKEIDVMKNLIKINL